MNQAQLIKTLSNTMGKTKVIELGRILEEQQFALHDLIDITFHPLKPLAFRAAWLLENVFLKHPDRFRDDLGYLLSRFNEIENPGCQRHYAKIVMHITAPKAPGNIQHKLADLDLEPIVEQLFEWMIDPKIKIVVKVFAARALFNLRERYSWIADELPEQLDFLMRDGSAAIQSAGSKMFVALKK